MALNNQKFLKDKLSIIDEEDSIMSQGISSDSDAETRSENDFDSFHKESKVFKYSYE